MGKHSKHNKTESSGKKRRASRGGMTSTRSPVWPISDSRMGLGLSAERASLETAAVSRSTRRGLRRESGLWKPVLQRGKEHQDCVHAGSSLGFVLEFLSPREQLFCSPEFTEIRGPQYISTASCRTTPPAGHGVIGPWSRRPFAGLVPEGWDQPGPYSVSWTLYSEQRDLLGHCVEDGNAATRWAWWAGGSPSVRAERSPPS